MNQDSSPTTPPPELVQQWFLSARAMPVDQWVTDVATQAAHWGADQELEACCEILRGEFNYHHLAEPLRAARRPKPPSLKEQALEKLAWIDEKLEAPLLNHCDAIHTIRRALESLPD